MRKASGNVDLVLLASGKEQADPSAESGSAPADVQGNIKRLLFNDPTESCLWVVQLIVEATEGTTSLICTSRPTTFEFGFKAPLRRLTP